MKVKRIIGGALLAIGTFFAGAVLGAISGVKTVNDCSTEEACNALKDKSPLNKKKNDPESKEEETDDKK